MQFAQKNYKISVHNCLKSPHPGTYEGLPMGAHRQLQNIKDFLVDTHARLPFPGPETTKRIPFDLSESETVTICFYSANLVIFFHIAGHMDYQYKDAPGRGSCFLLWDCTI